VEKHDEQLGSNCSTKLVYQNGHPDRFSLLLCTNSRLEFGGKEAILSSYERSTHNINQKSNARMA
jgi:hypothetical protein